MFNFFRFRLALPLSILGILALFTPPSRAADDQFFDCTSGLQTTGVDVERAATACGASRFPGELGTCVMEVNSQTRIAAPDALSVCERTRRPTEVASCTINIHQDLLTEPSLSVLEHCGRSVLPERYATCVIDLHAAAELGVEDALSRCIRAGYRPWEIEPRL